MSVSNGNCDVGSLDDHEIFSYQAVAHHFTQMIQSARYVKRLPTSPDLTSMLFLPQFSLHYKERPQGISNTEPCLLAR